MKFSEYNDKLKPGVYELSTAMSPYDMMAVMSASTEEETEGEGEENVISTKSEATLWDEADDTVKDEEDESEDDN